MHAPESVGGQLRAALDESYGCSARCCLSPPHSATAASPLSTESGTATEESSTTALPLPVQAGNVERNSLPWASQQGSLPALCAATGIRRPPVSPAAQANVMYPG